MATSLVSVDADVKTRALPVAQTRSSVDEPARCLPPDKTPGLLEQASSKTRPPIFKCHGDPPMSRSDNRLPKSGKQQFLLLRLHNHLVLRLQNQKISKNRAKIKVCTLAAQASGWEVHIMIILLCEVQLLSYLLEFPVWVQGDI